MTDSTKMLAKLETLLAEEQNALKSGKITQLPELDERKNQILMSLSPSEITDSETILKLREIAARNQALMDAAHKGVRAARERFEALVTAQKPMKLYGPNGKKATMNSITRSTVEKRT